MLTEKTKSTLLMEVKNFLFNGSLKACHGTKVSTFVEEKFKQQFYKEWLYNPLLYYLEQEGISFLWYGKISMTNKWLMKPARNNAKYMLYHSPFISNQDYKIKYYYSDLVSLLFSIWILPYVVKERVASDDLLSKLSKKWGMKEWLGLQDTWCRESAKTVWCDRSDAWQAG